MTLPQQLANRLAHVKRVAAITGAGISVESGIQAYRGVGGLYEDPEEGDRTVEALSGRTLVRDPDRTWRVVSDLIARSSTARPNAAHVALADIERRANRFVLLTQNVDGLHRAAGSENIIDIHGDLSHTTCMSCHLHAEMPQSARKGKLNRAPRCSLCRGVLRPDVVLFEEMLPPTKLSRIERELVGRTWDLMLVVGTSALFPYISTPVFVAASKGTLTVEINPDRSSITRIVDFHLAGSAGVILPEIARLIGA